MTEIQLKKRWTLGKQIGQGGFGSVFETTCEDGEMGVIKLVPKTPGADREALFINLAGTPNVMPVLETGETTTDLVLRMPRADTSLAEHLLSSSGHLSPQEAVEVLRDVATALAHLDGSVVHRDLKPGNILRFNNHWCLADFGLARYVSDATDPNTRKFAWTPHYAAPEQWRFERATGATDVYSLGVLAHEVLSGTRPFQGPDFRNQHLHEPVPPLTHAPAPLKSLVLDCLNKASGARPNATTVLGRLNKALLTPSTAVNQLQAANAAVAVQQANAAAAASAARSDSEMRAQFGRKGLLEVTLGQGSLLVDALQIAPVQTIEGVTPTLDVIAFSAISVTQPRSFYGFEGRQHSLWFAAQPTRGEYRWLELAFMFNPLSAKPSPVVNPFAMRPGEDAHFALGSSMHSFRSARNTRPIDQGEEGDFLERWLSWLASASSGSLQHPSRLPED
jgi:eukaryotic-like serine/threonine-protein kinase